MISRLAQKMNSDSARSDPSLFDGEHLIRQTFGDAMLERELLALFKQQCGRLMPVIAGAGAVRDRLDAAHALKGSARAVGAWRVAAVAEQAEILLERGDAAGLASLRRELAEAVAATQAAIIGLRSEGMSRQTPLAIGPGLP